MQRQNYCLYKVAPNIDSTVQSGRLQCNKAGQNKECTQIIVWEAFCTLVIWKVKLEMGRWGSDGRYRNRLWGWEGEITHSIMSAGSLFWY